MEEEVRDDVGEEHAAVCEVRELRCADAVDEERRNLYAYFDH